MVHLQRPVVAVAPGHGWRPVDDVVLMIVTIGKVKRCRPLARMHDGSLAHGRMQLSISK